MKPKTKPSLKYKLKVVCDVTKEECAKYNHEVESGRFSKHSWAWLYCETMKANEEVTCDNCKNKIITGNIFWRYSSFNKINSQFDFTKSFFDNFSIKSFSPDCCCFDCVMEHYFKGLKQEIRDLNKLNKLKDEN